MFDHKLKRNLLFSAVAVISIALVSACGGSGASPTAAPPTAASSTAPTAAPSQPTAASAQPTTADSASATGKDYCKDNEGQLFLYNWPDYIAPETLEQFTAACNVQVTQDIYASNEDLLAKVTAGGTGYDVVAPTGYTVEIMKDKDLLAKLDKDALPNMKYLGPTFLTGRPHDPNSDYSVTKNWGTLGVMWNSDKVTEDIKTWDDLWKIAPKYAGKIIFVDSSPDVMGAALKYVGASWNSTDKGEIDKALDKLIEIKPQLRSFDTTYIAKLASEEVWIVLGYNGDAFAANAQRAEEGKPESIKYVVPSEGSNIWEDSWAILKDAPHPKAALAFINFLLDPKIQGQETNFTHYGSGEPDADQYMKPEIRSNPAIYPPDDVISKLESATVLPADILQYREEAWTKLKGS